MISRILLYQGSFDPPHDGHFDCLINAVKFTHAEKAVIIPNDNNVWKPNMQPLAVRIEMLKILFKGENVEIAEERDKKKWVSQAHVIFLIGSDAWPRFAAKEEIPYPEICIVCRNEEKPKISDLKGKKIYLFEQEKKGLSSTKVRELLNTHPEWYHQGLAGGHVLPLPDTLRQFIFHKGLYCQKERETRSAIEKKLLEKGQATFPNQTLTLNLAQASLSGNLCYILSGNAPLAFIKVFARENGSRYFANELAALKILKPGQTVDQIFWAEDNHLAVSYIAEPDFSRVWQQIGKDLVKISFSIGQALKELHSANQRAASLEETNDWMEATIKRLPLDQLGEQIKSYFSNLKGAPSICTYAHLDPNLGNFIEKNGTILLIDLEKMGSSIGEGGKPIGHPEYDYYQFLKNLQIQQFFYPLDSFEEIKKGFIEGYGETDRLFSPEVAAFCKACCLVKEALFYLQHNDARAEKILCLLS